MFVSSFSTFIQTNASERVAKQKIDKQELDNKSFSSKLSTATQSYTSPTTSTIPNNFISKSLVLNNKQDLAQQQNSTNNLAKNDLDNFSIKNSLINAKSAYEGNSKMFSLISVPSTALNQTPSIEKTLPPEPRDIKELNMRHKMVNTYIANDNYYKVTA